MGREGVDTANLLPLRLRLQQYSSQIITSIAPVDIRDRSSALRHVAILLVQSILLILKDAVNMTKYISVGVYVVIRLLQ